MSEPKNITDLLAIARRRKWSLTIPTILVFAIAAVVAFSLDPTYQSTSTILIEEQEIPRDFVMSTVTSFAEQRIQSINQRIMSTTRLLEIINRFNLYADKREKWTQEEIITRMRQKDIKFQTISADVMDRRTGRTMQATIAFSLSYRGDRPAVVQQVASVLASLYLEENLRIRKEQVTGASRFLEEEMKEVKAQLSKIETRITPFKSKYINELPEHLQINIQSLERIERDADRVRNELRTAKEREEYLQTQVELLKAQAERQQPKPEPVKPDPIEDADKALLNQMKAKLIHLKSKFSDQYPDVIKTKIEIEELEKTVAATARKKEEEKEASKTEELKIENPAIVTLASQLAGTRSEIESFKKELVDLSSKRESYQQRIESTPRVEETYKALILERQSLQGKYDDLMKKVLEAKVSQGLEKEQMGERFTLIDPARFPEKPVSPNIPAIILIGLVLGIGSGVGTAAIKEFADQSVRTMEELGAWAQVSVLGSIPHIMTRKDRRRKLIKRILIAAIILTTLAAAPIIFHFFIMDLDIFWAKLMRLMAKYM